MKTAEPIAEQRPPQHAAAFPPSALARIEEAVQERALAEQRRRRERLERAEALTSEARARLQALFGAERYSRWRRFRDERRAERRRRGLPPVDAAALESAWEREAAADRAAAQRMLAGLGISPEAVLGIQRESAIQILEALRPWSFGTAADLEIRGPDPSFGLTHGDAGIFVNTIEPPYSGNGSSGSWSKTGEFEREVTPTADRFTGRIGQNLEVSIHDAGDADFAIAEDHRQIRQLFLMPHAGHITVLITIRVEKATHGLTLEDEWGVSIADVEQNNFLTLSTVGSDGQATEPLKAVMSGYRKTRNATGQWISPAMAPDAAAVVAYVSSRSYSQDELVRLDVGSLSTNQVYTDDMEVTSRMAFRYRLERLVVTVLP